jgi:hypothetical protein
VCWLNIIASHHIAAQQNQTNTNNKSINQLIAKRAHTAHITTARIKRQVHQQRG